jgi:hypothetical protein
MSPASDMAAIQQQIREVTAEIMATDSAERGQVLSIRLALLRDLESLPRRKLAARWRGAPSTPHTSLLRRCWAPSMHINVNRVLQCCVSSACACSH